MTDPTRNGSDRSLGEVVVEVSEKASLLVREEIELAKAEISGKLKSLARGAGVGVAAGVFLFFALIMFLHGLAWFIYEVFGLPQAWMGFGIVSAS